jgi:hypothetical protein
MSDDAAAESACAWPCEVPDVIVARRILAMA